jgi:hypothetical protein
VRTQLAGATQISQMEWKKLGHEHYDHFNEHLKLVHAQRGVLFKLAAILAESPSVRPKARRRRCGPRMLVVAWALLIAYYAITVTYTCLWFINRDEETRELLIAKNFTNFTNDDVTAGTNAILMVWIYATIMGVGIGYLVIEPAVLFLRFGLFPACIRRYGVPPDNVDEELLSQKQEEEKQKLEEARRNEPEIEDLEGNNNSRQQQQRRRRNHNAAATGAKGLLAGAGVALGAILIANADAIATKGTKAVVGSIDLMAEIIDSFV